MRTQLEDAQRDVQRAQVTRHLERRDEAPLEEMRSADGRAGRPLVQDGGGGDAQREGGAARERAPAAHVRREEEEEPRRIGGVVPWVACGGVPSSAGRGLPRGASRYGRQCQVGGRLARKPCAGEVPGCGRSLVCSARGTAVERPVENTRCGRGRPPSVSGVRHSSAGV